MGSYVSSGINQIADWYLPGSSQYLPTAGNDSKRFYGLIPMALQNSAQDQQRQSQQEAAQATANSYNNAVDAAQAQISVIQQQQQIDDRRRQADLARQTASRRATMGAMGVDPTEGSAAAVLNGLASEADLQAQEAQNMANTQVSVVNNRLARLQQTNLLQQQNQSAAALQNLFNSVWGGNGGNGGGGMQGISLLEQ